MGCVQRALHMPSWMANLTTFPLLEEDGSLSSDHMPCSHVPVMEIIQMWRAMAGPKGRKKHKPFPCPKYDYMKGLTEQGKQAQQEAEAATRPPKMQWVAESDSD